MIFFYLESYAKQEPYLASFLLVIALLAILHKVTVRIAQRWM